MSSVLPPAPPRHLPTPLTPANPRQPPPTPANLRHPRQTRNPRHKKIVVKTYKWKIDYALKKHKKRTKYAPSRVMSKNRKYAPTLPILSRLSWFFMHSVISTLFDQVW